MTVAASLSFAPSLGTNSNSSSLGSVAFQAAAILAVFAVPTVAALALDARQINDVSVWMKPLHFELSLFIHTMTLGLLATLFIPAAAATRRLRWAYQASAFAAVAELSYIAFQAARGRASHFNFDTYLEETMYGVMGAGAFLLVACAFFIGLSMLRGVKPETGPGLRFGAAWGLMLGSIGTLITASVMSAGVIDGPGHWIGGVHSDAHGLPLTGWSTAAGDLRVPHFFATHIMQALPLLGLLADRLTHRQAVRIVRTGAIFMCAVVAATFVQALMGLPLLPF